MNEHYFLIQFARMGIKNLWRKRLQLPHQDAMHNPEEDKYANENVRTGYQCPKMYQTIGHDTMKQHIVK